MMRLNINFPKNLITESLLEQKNIPCTIRISKVFEVFFQEPLTEVIGVVEEWDRRLLEERVAAGAGGEFYFYSFAMISIKEISENIYETIDLSMFSRLYGWCLVLENGKYGPPRDFSDQVEDDFNINGKIKKRR